MSNYVGKTECFQCGREVDVSLNRAGMAYYRCAPCGVHVQQKTDRGNRLLLAKTRRFADPDEAPAPSEKPAQEARESREITEQKPAPATPAKTEKRVSLGFFSGR
jgi:DNA-directed RNA polymerase subunit RPC12/RpoP